MNRRSRQGEFAILIIAVSMAGGGCAKTNPVAPGGLQPPIFGASDSVFTDQQLAAAAYTSYAGPDGFYSEPDDDYGTLYVNARSVAPDALGNPSFELSTEDTAQARVWAVASVPWSKIDPRPPNLTRRYIEFEAYQEGQIARMSVRAHRSSYLDRSGSDSFLAFGFVGVLIPRPVDNNEVRGLAEYLWFKDHRGSWGTKVLSSFTRGSEGSILHTIYCVKRNPPFEFDFGESLTLLRYDYRVGSANGAITAGETYVRYAPGR